MAIGLVGWPAYWWNTLQRDDYVARAGPFCTSRDWRLLRLEVPTGVAILHDLACDSTHKANVTSSYKGNVLKRGQDVTVHVIGDKSLEVLLYRRFTILLLDKAFCVLGAGSLFRIEYCHGNWAVRMQEELKD